jgi:hypothetical protein
MIKNVFLQFCALLFCMVLPTNAMEQKYCSRPSLEAVAALERIHFYIFADRYQEASTVVRYAQGDPTFVALIKQDRDIEQLCNDHVEILQLVRETVIIQRGMMPADFFQLVDGCWRDEAFMSSLLQKTKLGSYTRVPSLIFLVHQLHVMRGGVDYFEPLISMQSKASISEQKIEEPPIVQPLVQLPGSEPIVMPLTKAQQEAYRALGIDIIAIMRKQQEARSPVDIVAIVKRQYRRLALQFHPDKNHELNTVERFKCIQAAYQLLTNPS